MTLPLPLTINPQRLRVLHAQTPDELPQLTVAQFPAAIGLESQDQVMRVFARTTWKLEIKHHSLTDYHHGPWASARRIWLRGITTVLSPSGDLVKRRWCSIALAMVNCRHSGPDSYYAYGVAAAQHRLVEVRAAVTLTQLLDFLQTPLPPRG